MLHGKLFREITLHWPWIKPSTQRSTMQQMSFMQMPWRASVCAKPWKLTTRWTQIRQSAMCWWEQRQIIQWSLLRSLQTAHGSQLSQTQITSMAMPRPSHPTAMQCCNCFLTGRKQLVKINHAASWFLRTLSFVSAILIRCLKKFGQHGIASGLCNYTMTVSWEGLMIHTDTHQLTWKACMRYHGYHDGRILCEGFFFCALNFLLS